MFNNLAIGLPYMLYAVFVRYGVNLLILLFTLVTLFSFGRLSPFFELFGVWAPSVLLLFHHGLNVHYNLLWTFRFGTIALYINIKPVARGRTHSFSNSTPKIHYTKLFIVLTKFYQNTIPKGLSNGTISVSECPLVIL